jgi:putative transposase
VWDTADYRKRYVGVLGSATARRIVRKNSEAWRSFFAAREEGEDTVPPGYWGNENDGRELRTYIRNDRYTLETGERSRLEIPVRQDLKDEYGLGYRDRLRLEVCGTPEWDGERGRVELYYDEIDDAFRAIRPVTVPNSANVPTGGIPRLQPWEDVEAARRRTCLQLRSRRSHRRDDGAPRPAF